ncbi:MAG: hypothetical protein PUA98_03115 [Selenomonadaceae bacterium]|nr:hypothetical protein [Selenomonadaceae bacterium]
MQPLMKSKKPILTAAICLALSTGTAYAATPDENAALPDLQPGQAFHITNTGEIVADVEAAQSEAAQPVVKQEVPEWITPRAAAPVQPAEVQPTEIQETETTAPADDTVMLYESSNDEADVTADVTAPDEPMPYTGIYDYGKAPEPLHPAEPYKGTPESRKAAQEVINNVANSEIAVYDRPDTPNWLKTPAQPPKAYTESSYRPYWTPDLKPQAIQETASDKANNAGIQARQQGQAEMEKLLSSTVSLDMVKLLTNMLNSNKQLSSIDKLNYIIGYGRAINNSALPEAMKLAIIKTVTETFH